MNLGSMWWTFSRILPFPGIVCVISFFVSLSEPQRLTSAGFFLAAVVFLLVTLLARKLSSQPKNLEFKTQALSFVLLWLFTVLVTSIPFLFVPEHQGYGSFSSAFFEAMSGCTSTGLTMAVNSSQLESSVQLYRSLLQWLGGAGFALFAVVVIDKDLSIGPVIKASGLETHNLSKGQDLLKAYFAVYTLLTLATLLIFLILQMSPWEALNHSFTVVATGGFSVTSNSFASYSPEILVATAVLLILAALPFPVIYMVFKEKSLRTILKPQVVFYVGWIFLFLAAAYFLGNQGGRGLFNIVSAATTAGFSAASPALSNSFQFQALIVLMIIGGCTASTAGGVKIQRLVWVIRGIGYRFFRSGPESEAKGVSSEAFRQIRFAALYLILSVSFREIGGVALVALEPASSSSAVFFDAASAIATTGLSSGFVSSQLSDVSKYLLSGIMFLGRLEYAVVAGALVKSYSLIKS